MEPELLVLYVALAGTLMRSVLAKLNRVTSSCAHCGLPLERRELGQQICACER
jgi:hypothetical protein